MELGRDYPFATAAVLSKLHLRELTTNSWAPLTGHASSDCDSEELSPAQSFNRRDHGVKTRRTPRKTQKRFALRSLRVFFANFAVKGFWAMGRAKGAPE